MALTGCRSEHEVPVNGWITGHVKVPPAGIVQLLPPTASLSRNGSTILESRSLWFVRFSDTLAVHDHASAFVGLVTAKGDVINLREHGCTGGMFLIPQGVEAIDCWTSGRKETFEVTRFNADGSLAFKAMAPRLTACGGDRMGFLGYDSSGQPVAAYECITAGVRTCNAVVLGGANSGPVATVKADTADVDCGFALKSQRAYIPARDAQSWEQVR